MILVPERKQKDELPVSKKFRHFSKRLGFRLETPDTSGRPGPGRWRTAALLLPAAAGAVSTVPRGPRLPHSTRWLSQSTQRARAACRWRSGGDSFGRRPLPGPGPRPGRAVRGLPSRWAAASPLSSPGKPRRQPPGSRRSESSCQARRPGRPAALGAWGSAAAPTSARQAPSFPAASVTSDRRPKSNQFSKAERRSPGPHVLCAGPLTNSSTVHPVYALSRRRQGGA